MTADKERMPEKAPLSEKAQLKEKLIGFQQTIAELKLEIVQKEALFCQREKDFFSNIFDVMDVLAGIEKNLETKKNQLDKTAKMLGRNIASVHKKLQRHFNSADIFRMEFPDNKATMAYCKIIETRNVSELENETILEIVKNGYINKRDGTVLRKAEVITVLNESGS